MKRILLIGLCMEIGGAERALIGLLDTLDEDKYQVDLFLQRHTGEFMSLIPRKIHLLPEQKEFTALAAPVKKTLKKRLFLQVIGRCIAKFKAKIYLCFNKSCLPSAIELEYSHKYTKRFMPMISSEEYDLVISFCAPHYFGIEKAKGKTKIAWIHTDYSAITIDVKSEKKMWESYDYIASISPSCTESFCRVFPELKGKIVEIENILSNAFVKEQANEYYPDEMQSKSVVRLLSIGRFCTAKNFDNVPDICRRLCEKGLDIKWYLIGFGGDEALIRQKIREAGMDERVIMLGKKENPYPYIAACDLYVQPSRYEGKCVTVREAQMLGKPVVITRYATSASQLEEDVDGVIVPLDNEGCAEGIAALLQDPQKMQALSENCRMRDYSNAHEAEKLYALMN